MRALADLDLINSFSAARESRINNHLDLSSFLRLFDPRRFDFFSWLCDRTYLRRFVGDRWAEHGVLLYLNILFFSTARRDLSIMENFIVGIIGLGDMGKMYARRLSAAGWK